MILDWFIKKAQREGCPSMQIVTFDDKHLCTRYMPFWIDEWRDSRGRLHAKLPWWRPFNLLVHKWNPEPTATESFHDHPRWSISICLAGKLTELTPWGERVLTPGSIVFRSRKAIHAFRVAKEDCDKTWTLFIVGPRRYPQNSYVVARHN